MKQPLNLTEEEKDILLDILLKEVNDISNLNATQQTLLEQYKQCVMKIYRKVVDNIDD